jgi:DNA repair exonuclease SbcCD ATPase subunit
VRLKITQGVVLNVLSVFDRENWKKPSDDSVVNIALYHGSIHGCQTSQGWVMEEAEDSVNIFNDFDYAMLGDIHKQQWMDVEGRVRYAGSTIQQNFGESINKGFLLWEIRGKDDWDCQHVSILNPRPFITIDLTDKGKIPKSIVPKGCRLRIRASSNISPIMLKAACDHAQAKWSPHSVSFVNNGTKNSSSTSLIGKGVKSENLRDIIVQEKYIKEYVKDLNLSDEVMDKVLELNKKYNQKVEESEEVSRNVIWKIKEVTWDNLFNYGEKNKINFDKLSGLVGIFGKNYSGKSSIIDSVLFNLFNATSKGERKNVHVINQNKDYAKCKIKIEAGNDSYQISRNLNKHYRKSKGREVVDCKVDLDFTKTTGGVFESNNGTTRNQTDANIRKRFGTIDDFFLTSMASQLDSMSFLKEGSTKRKEIIAKFLDLQIFDQKFKLAKKDAADLRGVIKRLESKKFAEQIQKKTVLLEDIRNDIDEQQDKCDVYSRSIARLDKELAEVIETINAIPAEIIDPDKVKNEIRFKNIKKDTLFKESIGAQKEIERHNEFIEYFDDTIEIENYERLLDAIKEAERFESQKTVLGNNIRRKKTEYKNLQKTVSLLKNHEYDPDCRFCCDNEFVKEAEAAKLKLPEVEKEWQAIGEELAEIVKKCEEYDLKQLQKQIRQVQDTRDRYETSLDEIEKLNLVIERNTTGISLLDNEVTTLKEKLKEYEDNKEAIENKGQLFGERSALEIKLRQNRAFLKKCDDLTKQFLIEEATTKEIIRNLHEEQNEYNEVLNEYRAFDVYQTCMHPNGISYEVIQQKLPIINQEISKILSSIVDFEVFFENEDNKLELSIKHPNYGSRPLSMGSGAEKTIASMAIRLAMIAITNLPKSELFILDEPATALDQEHMEGFTRLLQMIKNQFKTVLIISHLDHLKDVVDMTIDIDKIDGYAKVNI